MVTEKTEEYDWDKHFLQIAVQIAKSSEDDSTKVGCVIVFNEFQNRKMIAYGVNSFPSRVLKTDARMVRPTKYLWTCHAEENAIAAAAGMGSPVIGSKLYVTHRPCARCARLVVQSGIIEVIIPEVNKHSLDARWEEEVTIGSTMFKEAGVKETWLQISLNT